MWAWFCDFFMYFLMVKLCKVLIVFLHFKFYRTPLITVLLELMNLSCSNIRFVIISIIIENYIIWLLRQFLHAQWSRVALTWCRRHSWHKTVENKRTEEWGNGFGYIVDDVTWKAMLNNFRQYLQNLRNCGDFYNKPQTIEFWNFNWVI